MRRFLDVSTSIIFPKGLLPRFFGFTKIETPSAVKDAFAAEERNQRERELAVDSRSVVFTSGASADHRPRIAVAEAFDVAAAALTRPPNFCFAIFSLDYEVMVDALGGLWHNMCRANDVTTSSVRPQQLHMAGVAGRHQRPGGGYVQVLLGCIPDLQLDVFAFDTVPEEDDLSDSNRPPAAMCLALLDYKLALQYEHVLSGHIQLLGERLGGVPLVGAVCPPAVRTNQNDDGNNYNNMLSNKTWDSLCFINDRVYTGSALGVTFRSAMFKSHQINVVPSISVRRVEVTSVSRTDDIFSIMTLDNRKASDVIRETYCSSDLMGKTSKLFLGIQQNNVCIPLSFYGNPDTGHLQFLALNGVDVNHGDKIELLVDDVELDSEVAAGLLISMRKRLSVTHVTKGITIEREARKNIVASSVAAFHFSHAGMNVVARQQTGLSLGNSHVNFLPSVLQRCVGSYCPTTGLFCPGQVITLGRTSGVFARSSSYCFLEGLK